MLRVELEIRLQLLLVKAIQVEIPQMFHLIMVVVVAVVLVL